MKSLNSTSGMIAIQAVNFSNCYLSRFIFSENWINETREFDCQKNSGGERKIIMKSKKIKSVDTESFSPLKRISVNEIKYSFLSYY
jgi:hypothetical protein